MIQPLWPIEYILVAGLSLALVYAWAGWRSSSRAGIRIRLMCVGLRGLAGAAIVCLALNPGRWRYPESRSQPAWHFLLDSSQSMRETDDDSLSRWEEARTALTQLAADLPEAVPVMYELFSDSRTSRKNLSELEAGIARGQQSDVSGSLSSLLRSYLSRPASLGGVVVGTDAIQLPEKSPAEAVGLALALNIPVYGVIVGGAASVPDLELRPDRVTVPAFVNQPLKLPFNIRATGLGRIAVTVEVKDEQGRVCAQVPVRLQDGEKRKVLVECPAPSEPGYRRFHLSTRVFPGENRTLNNQLDIGVQVLDSEIRVMMIEGLPHWDSKFLAQLLRAKDYIRLTELYRLGPDRFYRIQEPDRDTRTPGGTDQGETLEKDSRGLFPASLDHLSTFDAVILGKGVDAFLSPADLAVLNTFVAERGGALIFSRGRPWRKPVPELSELEPLVWGDAQNGRFALAPTPEGETAGLFGEKLPSRDAQTWSLLPTIEQLYGIQRLKPFTRVLAETAGERIPILVSRRFGRGLTIAVNAEGLWQWDFFPQVEESRQVYRDFWPLLVQWALTTADFPPGCELAARVETPVVRVGESLQVDMLARSPASVPEGMSPGLEAVAQNGHRRPLVTHPSPGAAGRWRAVCSFEQPGLYELRPVLPGGGKVAGTGVEVLPLPAEIDRLSYQPELLREICEKTGGRLIEPGDPDWPPASAEQAVKKLDQAVWAPDWDRWPVLLIIALIACLEWYLRRRHMLA